MVNVQYSQNEHHPHLMELNDPDIISGRGRNKGRRELGKYQNSHSRVYLFLNTDCKIS